METNLIHKEENRKLNEAAMRINGIIFPVIVLAFVVIAYISSFKG